MTSTFYYTAEPEATGGPEEKIKDNNSPAEGSGSGAGCAPQVTVTVTGPPQTVTVVCTP